MIYLKWLLLCVIDWLLILSLPVAVPVIAAFTRAQPHGQYPYSWGWIWGTYDNPPQGDEGFVRKRAWFPGETYGWKGYLNRIHWMIRNPLYGAARKMALDYSEHDTMKLIGKDGISDKYKIPGWYWVRLYKRGVLVGFEFYGVFPYLKESRVLRIRLGWKILTEKFEGRGFAQFVNTANPFGAYGDD